MSKEIAWPKSFVSEAVWCRNNFDVVNFLLKHGEVVCWKEDQQGYRYPEKYEVNNVKVEFLPIWGSIKIGNNSFRVPDMEEKESKDKLLRIIELTRELQELAMQL